ncbi:unnamed protein product [Rotaria socialis]
MIVLDNSFMYLKILIFLFCSNFLLLYSTTDACGISEWRCETGGRCIPTSWRCNRIADCTDSSDERNCTYPRCSDSQFDCGDRCIPRSWMCDGDNDCGNNTDEQNCPPRRCSNTQFQCNDSRCIEASMKCNHVKDCTDGTDEGAFCNFRQCDSSTEYQCDIQRCLPLAQKCDGYYNCDDRTDELNCNSTACSTYQFRCVSDGRCIPNYQRCDFRSQCTDGSDETNCTRPNCTTSQFRCSNGRCIPSSWVCDRDDDCLDRSDEMHCSARQCPPHMYPCNVTGQCIDITKICNGQQDCSDGTDESSQCGTQLCGLLSCEHACQPTPDGRGKCYCPLGFQINPVNNRSCIDVNECEIWDECDQDCQNTIGSYVCTCRANYTLEVGNRCKHINSDNMKMFVAIANKIYEIDRLRNARIIYTGPENMTIHAVDYHYRNQLLYFADPYAHKIYSLSLSSLMSPAQLVLEKNIRMPMSIAIDWITNKMYIVETELARIDMFSLDGKMMKTNIVINNIYEPSSIAIDPIAEYLFFADEGDSFRVSAKINRCLLDGSQCTTLIDQKLSQPSDLTVDFIKKRIYWVDRSYDHVESCDYHGSRRITITSGSQNIPYTVGIDLFENNLYLTDDVKGAVLQLRRHFNSNTTYFHKPESFIRPRGIAVYHETRQPHRNDPCNGTYNGGCEHLCLLGRGYLLVNSYQCRCQSGYRLKSDLKSCEPMKEFLLLSRLNSIRGVDLNRDSNIEARPPIIPDRRTAISDSVFDYEEKTVYFYAQRQQMIYSSKMDGEKPVPVTTSKIFPMVNALAYDWYSKLLYMTSMANSQITVVRMNGRDFPQRVLANGTIGIHGIALDPLQGYVFYSTIARPAKIYRMLSDGTNRNVIIPNELGAPYHLTCDYSAKRLYWTDGALSRIQHSDYNGRNIQSLRGRLISHPFGIAIYGSRLYFTDATLEGVFESSKTYSGYASPVRSNVPSITTVRVYAESSQPINITHPCRRNNGECSDFCFPRRQQDTLTRICGCRYGRQINPANNQECIDNSQAEPDQTSCNGRFQCRNGRCISQSYKCDGDDDCHDNSDEQNCPAGTPTCGTNQFQCRTSGICINKQLMCDGYPHCHDRSDESNCTQTCSQNQFRCATGKCIPKSWICDNDNDCGDSSDELNCQERTCDLLTQFACTHTAGKCIPNSWKCDGQNDCGDNADELNCPPIACGAGQFLCSSDHYCINATRRCDGIADCQSMEDERNCAGSTPSYCRADQFRCGSTCIPNNWRCDGHRDCADGSDEPSSCGARNCTLNEFRCLTSGDCIPKGWMCDNEDDCEDSSDENAEQCQTASFSCPENQMVCPSTTIHQCVNITQVCDNKPDCPGGGDESPLCNNHQCSIDNGGCSHACHRSPFGVLCLCQPGFHVRNTTGYKKCEDINECEENPNTCHQHCLNTNGSFICACNEGFVLQADGRSCKIINETGIRLLTLRQSTMEWFSPTMQTYGQINLGSDMRYITAFDVDNRTNTYFWSDLGAKTIYSRTGRANNYTKLITSGNSYIGDIAFDWIGRNLYWTDYMLEHVEVATVDGRYRRILFHENLTNPWSLAIDPRAGARYLFLTDWGTNPRIERASMDGQQRISIVNNSIEMPIGLTLDLMREEVYFTDHHLNFIEVVSYNGEHRRKILANSHFLHGPTSIALFEQYLYWYDSNSNEVRRLNRFEHGIKAQKHERVLSRSRINSMKISHQIYQPFESNPCQQARCSQLCLLSNVAPAGYTCACSTGFFLERDQITCSKDYSPFIIYMKRDIIGGISVRHDQKYIDENSNYDDLWERFVPVTDVHNGYEFAFDEANETIYWAQIKSFLPDATPTYEIRRINFDGTNETVFYGDDEILVGMEVGTMQVDAVGRNLFIANIRHSRIDAISLNGQYHTVVFSEHENATGIIRPIALDLDTINGFVYWIDLGGGQIPLKIARVRFDGKSPENVVVDNLLQPNYIVYNLDLHCVFWSDFGLQKISYHCMDSGDTKVLDVEVNHPRGFDFLTHLSPPTSSSVIANENDDITSTHYSLFFVDNEYEGVYKKWFDHRLNPVTDTIPVRTNQEDPKQVRAYPRYEAFNSYCFYGSYCEQICFYIDTNHGEIPTCDCAIGYKLNSDGRTCSPKTEQYIVYSTHSLLRAFDYRSNDSAREDVMPLIPGNNMEMLSVRYSNRELYWINANRLIRRAVWTSNRTWNITNYLRISVGSQANAILGLALDWISGNLYVSYVSNSYGHLEVNRLGTDHRLILRKGKNETIYAIAVNPKRRFLYWCDRGARVRISRSFLNGENVTYLVTSQIIRPESITIDYLTDDVYWSDSIRDTVEVISWDGRNRRTVTRNIPKAISILIANNDLYIMDRAFSSIMRINKTVSNMTQRLESILTLKTYEVGGMALFDEQPNYESPCQTSTVRQRFCEDLCFAMPDTSVPQCACAYGTLSIDRRTCTPPKEYLLVAMEKEIRSMSMEPHGSLTSAPWRAITNLSMVVGIDFDYRDKKIFYTDLRAQDVFSFDMDDTNPQSRVLVQSNVTGRSQPVGISYDWVSDRLYWTDERYGRIISSRINGSEKLIIASSSQPRAIVVHPCKGLLFWSDVGVFPSIRRSTLTGRQVTYVITTNIRWPNGLTIDFDDDRIYWADAWFDRIERASLDGTNRETISTVIHPFAITVHGHYIYWTDWSLRGIYRAEKYTGANMVEMQNELPYRPMDIHVVSDQRQKCSSSPCNVSNGGCSHICKTSGENQVECACPSGEQLKLVNDRRMCVPLSSSCASVNFTCRNGQCISRRKVCDSQSDCSDGSDEDTRFCSRYTCRPTEYRCLSGGCIPYIERCDRKQDCNDGSDENNPFQPCVYPQCPEGQFTCRNFRCIDNFKRCNGYDDCFDGNATDEVGCPSRVCNGTNSMKCPNNNICIRKTYLCDGDNDCGDNSDESSIFCHSIQCNTTEFRCGNGRCVPYSWVCDGQRDCVNGTDEPSDCFASNRTCPIGLWKCDNGRCISPQQRCNGIDDCRDGSDEDERHNCAEIPCSSTQFRCASGLKNNPRLRCLDRSAICNGIANCMRGEDEANCTRRNCSSNQFQCANGLCVPRSYVCDHDNDCGDGSDEPISCQSQYRNCSSTEYRCENGRCVPRAATCNGYNDCHDNSDEKPSLCETEQCPAGQFQCRNKQCIPYEVVCNGVSNCTDGSDEPTSCGVNECASSILSGCEHGCVNTLTSFRCTCRSGYKLASNQKNCWDINECIETPSVCQQLCENIPGSYMCKCAPGYQKGLDGRSCYRTNRTIVPYVLYTNKYYVRTIDIDEQVESTIARGFMELSSITYDWKDQKIYVSDRVANKIYRMNLNGTQSAVVLEGNQMRFLRAIAVDWIGRKLYQLTGTPELRVSELDGRFGITLLDSRYLSQPNYIAIDPLVGYLFYSDWGQPHIGRINLDGSNFVKIISTDIAGPLGLTIDLITNRIFWIDRRLQRLEFSNYNGGDRKIAFSGHDYVPYSLAVAFIDGYTVWSDFTNHSLIRANALNGSNKHILLPNTINEVMALTIVHPSLQPEAPNPCGTNNGGCSHLCLLTTNQSYTCACPEHFSFINAGNNRTCVSNCSCNQHRCGPPNERCIPWTAKCNGVVDCEDGSDEPSTCPQRRCPSEQFQCRNQSCTPVPYVCDGMNDCGDNSDEENCQCRCMPGTFQCNSGLCLPMRFRCDGHPQCADGSDELNCGNRTCAHHQFTCNNGRCIPASYECDLDNDCGDNSDENAYFCRNRPCRDDQVRCPNSYKCISHASRCNGFNDCGDNSDENPNQCPSCNDASHFRCNSGQCIPRSFRCNHQSNCRDGSDENPETCVYRECSEDEFRCNNGRCIPERWVCDHDYDCGGTDTSDEDANCVARPCPDGKFKCSSGHCISNTSRCDSYAQCRDGSDEAGCPPRYPDGRHCPVDRFTCNNTLCINNNWVCDGDNDCRDNSDETIELCRTVPCNSTNHFRCANGRCIYRWRVCDHEDNCGDGSDEDIHGVCQSKNQPLACSEFHCTHTNLCIRYTDLCDEIDDCGDASDELSCHHNTTLTCANQTSHCDQRCHDLPNGRGIVCSCNIGYKFNKESLKCEDINECENVTLNYCSQICINTKGGYQCECAAGFEPSGTNRSDCHAADQTIDLLISEPDEIRRLRRNSVEDSSHYGVLVEDQHEVGFISIDTNTRMFYWVDESALEVFRAHLTPSAISTTYPQSISYDDTNHAIIPSSISIDWIGQNLYLSDVVHGCIWVSKNDGRYAAKLITNIESPWVVTVNPILGIIYFINYETTHIGDSNQHGVAIESAYMNGENRTILVDTDIIYPTDLVIDFYHNYRVYWTDEKKESIESMNYDGTDRIVIAHIGIHAPHSLDIFGSHLYWIHRDNRSLYMIEKFGRGISTLVLDKLESPLFVRIYHPLKQIQSGPNPCATANCSHLCVLKPMSQYECICPFNTTIQQDTRTCNAPIVAARENVVQCNCLHGKCVYHVDENSHSQLTGCVCLPGYKGTNCDTRSEPSILTGHKFGIVIAVVVGLLLISLLTFGLIQLKRKGKLQSISNIQLPTGVRTTMNNIRNFITRSTNINIVRFQRSQSSAARDMSTIESPPVFANPMFSATASNQPAQVSASPSEPAKLNIETYPPPSKPTRKGAPTSPPRRQVHFDPQSKETDHDKANLVVRSSSSSDA